MLIPLLFVDLSYPHTLGTNLEILTTYCIQTFKGAQEVAKTKGYLVAELVVETLLCSGDLPTQVSEI